MVSDDESGFSPNVVSFNMLVDRSCRNAEVRLTIELVQKMRMVSRNHVEPNYVIYYCLVNGLCKDGKAIIAK